MQFRQKSFSHLKIFKAYFPWDPYCQEIYQQKTYCAACYSKQSPAGHGPGESAKIMNMNRPSLYADYKAQISHGGDHIKKSAIGRFQLMNILHIKIRENSAKAYTHSRNAYCYEQY